VGPGGFDSSSSTVYNVCVAQRAIQKASFLILTALAASRQPGYGIITDVKAISGGRVRLRAWLYLPPLLLACGAMFTAVTSRRPSVLMSPGPNQPGLR